MTLFKKKEEQEEGKSKVKKQKLSRVAANNIYALKIIRRAAPGFMILYLSMTVINSLLYFLSGTYALRIAVNNFQNAKPPAYTIVFILSVAALSFVFHIFTSFVWNAILPKKEVCISREIKRMMFEKAAEVELACYEDPAFFDKYVKAMDGAEQKVRQTIYTLNDLLWRIVSLFANSALLFVIDPVLIVFGLMPLLLGYIKKKRVKIDHDFEAAVKPIDRRRNYVKRTFYLNEYAKEMRLSGIKTRMLAQLRKTQEDYIKLSDNYGRKRVILRCIVDIGLEVVTILGATAYSIWSAVGRKTMLYGDCIIVLNSIGDISYSLNNLSTSMAEFEENSIYIEDMRYFLTYEPKIKSDPQGATANGGRLCVNNVSFRYLGSGKDVLKDVSLYVDPGEKIALVGLNGSGKTTLVKLLMRLYEPLEGTITLDGRDQKEYTLSSWRGQYSAVFQDFKNFSLSVSENVLLKPTNDADDELVEKALKQSGGFDKISALPGGVKTILTREFDDDGAVLSTGESQKVSLARAFAENKPFIILDEPSSALDPIAEYTMFNNMMRAGEGKSVIFVSHRLSCATLADRIYMFENGRIIESGSHSALMKRNGSYADMFRKQAENYVGAEVTA